MRFERNTMVKVGVAAALCLLQCQFVLAQPSALGAQRAPRGGAGMRGGDPRIQNRTYTFTETNEELPYAVFVSSKVSKDKKNPLIIALHGLGGNTLTMLNRNALELAEEGGYILVGPMGYNSSGWYGIPARGAGAGARGARGARGRGAATPPGTPPAAPPATPPATAPAAPPADTSRAAAAGTIRFVAAPIEIGPPAGPLPGSVIENAAMQPPAEGGSRAGAARGMGMGMQPGAMGGAPGMGMGMQPGAMGGARGMGATPGFGMSAGGAGGSAVTDQAKVREMSEKDVMNVLDMILKEFNVDESRIYLMGHSMGGAGTLNLGVKYASKWAAIGAMAPAAFGLQPDILANAKDLPVIIVQGDADTLVPASGTRPWVEKMKELGMTYEYHEVAGGDHGSVMTTGMPLIFKFFDQHTKPKAESAEPAEAAASE